MIEETRVWPWIIPLPIEGEKHYKVLLSVFKSKATLDILKNIKLNGKTYQSDLIRKLPYSNKTVICKLRELVRSKILEQGVERKIIRGRSVRVNWFKPTPLGRWLITFLTPPSEMKPENIEKTLSQLFKLYIKSITRLCANYGFDISEYHQELEEEYIKELIQIAARRRGKEEIDATVVGSISLDITVSFHEMPKTDAAAIAKIVKVASGGSAANVAIALTRLGLKTSFMGKVGTDEASRIALTELASEGVDISPVKVVRGATLPKSIVFIEKSTKRILTITDEKALSLSSPEEVDWEAIDLSKIIYIGETYTEIASIIASYAKAKGKIVIYRLLTPYAKMGLSKLKGVLANSNYVIMNEVSWKILRETSKNIVTPHSLILNYGVDGLIITRGGKGVTGYTGRGKLSLPAIKIGDVVDTTGAGDAFSAAFIWALIGGSSFEKAVKIANIAAAMSTTKLGAKDSMPTINELRKLLASRPSLQV